MKSLTAIPERQIMGSVFLQSLGDSAGEGGETELFFLMEIVVSYLSLANPFCVQDLYSSKNPALIAILQFSMKKKPERKKNQLGSFVHLE